MRPLRVAILGAPGTGKHALVQDLQTESANSHQWQLHHNEAAMHALNQQLQQAPDEATGQQAIAAYLQQPEPNDLILLTALDQPTQDDVATLAQRQLLDQSLRRALAGLGLPYTLLYGNGTARRQAALQAIAYVLQIPSPSPPSPSHWRWACDKCSDPDCEHRMFRSLIT